MLPGQTFINGLSSGVARSKTYRTTLANAGSTSSYTFSSVAIGTATDTRYVLVGVTGRAPGARTLNSVTIAGITATILGNTHNTGGGTDTISAFAIAKVTSGTTANIVVTFSSTMAAFGCSVWTLDGLDSATARTYVGDTSDPFNGTLNAKADGWVFGVGMDFSNSGVLSWTNLTSLAAIPATGATTLKAYAADATILSDNVSYAASATNAGFSPAVSFLSMY